MQSTNRIAVGDVVVAVLDQDRGIDCYGTVLECCGNGDVFVLWSSESLPKGYWNRTELKVIIHQGEKP